MGHFVHRTNVISFEESKEGACTVEPLLIGKVVSVDGQQAGSEEPKQLITILRGDRCIGEVKSDGSLVYLNKPPEPLIDAASPVESILGIPDGKLKVWHALPQTAERLDCSSHLAGIPAVVSLPRGFTDRARRTERRKC